MIKYRYILKNEVTGGIERINVGIEEIESGALNVFIRGFKDKMIIVQRDRFTGKTDLRGRYVYENDEFIYRDCLRVVKYREDNLAFMAEPFHKERDWNKCNFFLRDVLVKNDRSKLSIEIL